MLARLTSRLLSTRSRRLITYSTTTSLLALTVLSSPTLNPWNSRHLHSTSTTMGSNGSSTAETGSAQYPLQISEDEWRVKLSKEQFRILREKGTEMAGTGEYDKHYPNTGIYECAGCQAPLYKAEHKFSSGCGWPAFFDAIPGAVKQHEDRSWGMKRTEIVCSNCGGHLGHLFRGEGFKTGDRRDCVNSVSIKFNEQGGVPAQKE